MKTFWLFVGEDKVAEWNSLWSCQQNANSYEGDLLSWKEAKNGPQGNGPHWYAFGKGLEYLIIEID